MGYITPYVIGMVAGATQKGYDHWQPELKMPTCRKELKAQTQSIYTLSVLDFVRHGIWYIVHYRLWAAFFLVQKRYNVHQNPDWFPSFGFDCWCGKGIRQQTVLLTRRLGWVGVRACHIDKNTMRFYLYKYIHILKLNFGISALWFRNTLEIIDLYSESLSRYHIIET